MKTSTFITMFVIFGMALFSGCASSMHIWLVYERGAENKLVAIEERIGDGLKTDRLSPDESRIFLTTLKGIRKDCAELRDKNVYQEKWNSLYSRLDVLREDLDRSLIWTTKTEKPRPWEKIATIQKYIDDGRTSGGQPLTDEREFQANRLDSIRKDYLQIAEEGRRATYEEGSDLSQRLDSLAMDIHRDR